MTSRFRPQREAHWHTAEAAFLAGVSLFAGMATRELISLAACTRIGSFPSGETVLQSHERAEVVLLVHSGLVRLFSYSAGGHEATITFVRGRPGACGIVFPDLCPGAAVETLVEDTVVCRLSHCHFRDFVQDHPAAVAQLTAALARQLSDAGTFSLALTSSRVIVRLARVLVRLAAVSPGGVVRLTRDQLASMIHCTPAEVSRKLARLHEDHLIELRPHHKREIVVLNADALLTMADND